MPNICDNKKNLKLIVAYDGKNYLGWQKTPEGPSIEASLETVLQQIFQHPVQLQAASRTDAGVHANGQVVNFFTSKPEVNLSKLKNSLNSLLKKDIAILEIEEMALPFHPTLDAIGKEYHYYLCYDDFQFPQLRHYSWHVPFALNIDDMKEAASILIGKHDFSSFCNAKKNSSYLDYFREISSLDILELENKRLCIRIVGNHFLYKMVRTIVGTLVYVGKNKIKKEEIPFILSAKYRPEAGMTAPSHGLYLHKVSYNKER